MDMTSIGNNEKFDGFFSDFFKSFSVERENETSIKEAEIPPAENDADAEPEMEFSAENITFPESEIPTEDIPVASQEEKEPEMPSETENKVEEMPEETVSEEQEPVPQLRQFPKQLGEKLKKETSNKVKDEVKDFKSMSDIEIEEAVKPFTVDHLEEIDFDAPESTKSHEGFSIVDDKCADWALKKIHEKQREYLRLKELGEAEIEDIKERLEKVKKKYESSTRYLKSLLQEYFMKVPDKKNTTTQETYKLLNGNLVMKKASTSYEHDENVLLEFLKANELNQFIKLEETVKWGQLKKSIENDGTNVFFKDTGDCVEGVTVKETPAKFDVKFED